MDYTIISRICMTKIGGQHSPGTSGVGARARGYLPEHHRSTPWFLCVIALILAVIAICPVTADSKYMTGSPVLNAHIAGTNEFSPGDDVNLRVVVENTGLNQFKIVESGIIDANDLSNTAKQLTATLGTSDAPIVIKADPQVLGDLVASTSATGTFHIKVNQDAPAGTYQVPVALNYAYLYQQNQEGNTLSYTYKNVNETVYVPMKIKSVLQIALTGVTTENINPGNEGYVDLTVQNTGSEDATNAAILLQQNNQSPFTPTEGSEYIGDFPRGAVVDSRFRMLVSEDALQKTYPLSVIVNYKNSEGDYVYSDSETIGVPVGGKVNFRVTPIGASVSPGAKSVITIQYQNTGGATAYNAQAGIIAIDPFTTNDDTSFLGTMAPGDTRTASFDVSVASDAAIKEYGMDSSVTYRDSLDNQITSDPVKVEVQIVPTPSILSLIGWPGIIAIIIVVLAIAAFRIYTKRKAR